VTSLCIPKCCNNYSDFRQRNEEVLETKQNISISTTERLNEVSSTLFIDNCALADEGIITVTAENNSGSDSHVAKLTVIGV